MTEAAPTEGLLSLEALEQEIAQGRIDTVITALPDLFGRLVGKRIETKQDAVSLMGSCNIEIVRSEIIAGRNAISLMGSGDVTITDSLILSGDLTDHDGTAYREGDLVSLKAGTEHCSHTENGCVIAVYSESLETTV